MPQLAMVIDLNKCMGCQACTVACKVLCTDRKGMEHHWWMKTNTMPGRGYPRDWEQMGGGYDRAGRLVPGRKPTEEEYGGTWEFKPWEVYTSGGKGTDVHLTPGRPTWGPNWDEDIGGGRYPNAYFFYLPRLCNQCSRPSCAEACPLDAIYRRPEDGIVTIRETACPDCRDAVCIDACPYKEISWDPARRAARKCDFCLFRLERSVAPACLRQCPGRHMWIDYLENQDGVVHKLVTTWQVALPLHPEWGCEPSVYYVPPLSPPRMQEVEAGVLDVADGDEPRIPIDYLRSLFGERVEEALMRLKEEREKQRSGTRSELMWLLIVPRSTELMGPFRKDPSEVRTG